MKQRGGFLEACRQDRTMYISAGESSVCTVCMRNSSRNLRSIDDVLKTSAEDIVIALYCPCKAGSGIHSQ